MYESAVSTVTLVMGWYGMVRYAVAASSSGSVSWRKTLTCSLTIVRLTRAVRVSLSVRRPGRTLENGHGLAQS